MRRRRGSRSVPWLSASRHWRRPDPRRRVRCRRPVRAQRRRRGAGHARWHPVHTARSRVQAAVIHAARSREVSTYARRRHRRLLRRGSRAAARDGERPDSRRARISIRRARKAWPRPSARRCAPAARRRWPPEAVRRGARLPCRQRRRRVRRRLRARRRSTSSPRMPIRRWRSSSTCCGRRDSMRSVWSWRGRSGSRPSSGATTRPKRSRRASGRG